MTPLGATFFAAFLLLFWQRRSACPYLLAASAAFPQSVALNLGSNGFPLFYFVAVLFLASQSLGGAKAGVSRGIGGDSGQPALIAFVLWSALITFVAPAIFKDIRVLSARGGTDSQVVNPSFLSFSISNFAQLLYLGLGVAVCFFIARARPDPIGMLIGALGTGSVVSAMQYLSPSFRSVTSPLFDNSNNVRYIDLTSDGIPRFRGAFSEPAALAGFSVVALAVGLSIFLNGRGYQRWVSLIIASTALVNLIGSATGTAVAAGAIIGLVATWSLLTVFLTSRTRNSLLAISLVLLLLILAIWQGPSWLAFVLDVVQGKVAGKSYENRTAADAFSFGVLTDTWGLGAGLGSNRPSTFVPMLLSCTGLVGTFLFFSAYFPLLSQAWRGRLSRPVAWALISVMSTYIVSNPNLSEPLLWLSMGLAASVAWSMSSEEQVSENV